MREQRACCAYGCYWKEIGYTQDQGGDQIIKDLINQRLWIAFPNKMGSH